DCVASLGFRLNQFARRFAADLLVGSPKKHDLVGKPEPRMGDGIQREQRLDDSRLHIECSGTKRAASSNPEWHLGQCSGRINRIVMAQNQNLPARFRIVGGSGDAQMSASMFL